ncbi:hypothetical protein Z949_1320 [Sulfitobacter guttiformis KCTC 32187]|nr:hypothetical protein Z949_1320 [Sulfitobacter guttiformis KCTC 32187]
MAPCAKMNAVFLLHIRAGRKIKRGCGAEVLMQGMKFARQAADLNGGQYFICALGTIG